MINSARPLSGALAAIGAMALLPAIVSARTGQNHAPVFLATAAFCIFLAGALRFTTEGSTFRFRRADGLVGLTLLWLVPPLAATPAIAVVSGLKPLAAWLEAVSAFTATGLTAVDRAPASLYVWFALLQWSGGLLTLASVVAVIAPTGLGGLPDRAPRGGMVPDVVDIRSVLREIVPLYVGGTVLALVALVVSGQSFYVSFTLATAVSSAGAHLPPEAQLALAIDNSPKWLLMPFLLWSATSVLWHRTLFSRRLNNSPEQKESLVLLMWWGVLGIIIGAILVRALDTPPFLAVRDGFFSAASLIATSGIGPHDGTYRNLPLLLMIFVVLLGGGALSVAGGLKMMRMRAMLLRARGDLLRLVYPNLVQPAALEQGDIGSSMRGVWVALATLFATFGLCIIALSPGMPNLDAALAAAAAVVSNTGPVYDAGGLDWPSLSSLPAGSVIVAGLAMVAGRLEIVGLFVTIHFAFWRT
ncbi:MAG: potassium transporter TrkG [Xanthobacter sp.]